jgi:hypothetical protein
MKKKELDMGDFSVFLLSITNYNWFLNKISVEDS